MIRFILFCKQVFDKYSRDEMSVYAAQASFFTILAAFPFLMLLLALIQLVPIVHEADLLEFVVHVVPNNLVGLVFHIFESLHSDSPAAILSVTAIAALWSSSKGMLSIERGLNRVYGITTRRNYILRRVICSVYTILFTVMCVVCLALLVFGGMLQKRFLVLFPGLSRLAFLISPGRGLLTITVLIVFFTAIYTVLPFKRLPIRSQLPGAVFSAIGWAVFSVAFSVYFKYFSNYTVTYGSLTAVILMMLWLYFCICILFTGAELNWYFCRYRSDED
ncbi:MAG: YihY/virulence factor BrkB family protein [Lachnospiraceae bacterium]|nr:YihY/virulence factor BrkB family protein [Lachnospiraceae bacterium]